MSQLNFMYTGVVFDSLSLSYNLDAQQVIWNGYGYNQIIDYFHGSSLTSYEDVSVPEYTNVVSALEIWDEFSAFTLNETSSAGDINVFAVSSFTGGFLDGVTGKFEDESDVELYNVGDTTITEYTRADIGIDGSIVIGSEGYGYFTVLHETGHALGLAHPYNPNKVNIMTQEVGGYDGEHPDFDITKTVMSYLTASGEHVFDTPVTHWAITPMAYDIAALQELYSTATVSRNSGSVSWYDENSLGINGNLTIQTILDTGGTNDTIDFSNISGNHIIDLREAIDSQGNWVEARTVVNKDSVHVGTSEKGDEWIYISRGSVIENANGGSGDDLIVANSAENIIIGGGNGLFSADSYSSLNNLKGDTVDYSHTAIGSAKLINLGASNVTIDPTSWGGVGASYTIDSEDAYTVSEGTISILSTDVLSGIENIFDTKGSDTIIGNGDINVFVYSGGSDYYDGGGEKDYYFIGTIQSGDVVRIEEDSSGGDAFLNKSGSSYQRYVDGSDVVFKDLVGGGELRTNGNVSVRDANGTYIVDGHSNQTSPLIFEGNRNKLQLGTNPSGGTHDPNGDVSDSSNNTGVDSVTVTDNPLDGRTDIEIDVDGNIIFCGVPYLSEALFYVDGEPYMFINAAGELTYFPEDTPELDVIAGLKLTEDLINIFTEGDPEDILFGGQEYLDEVTDPDDLDDWEYSQTTYTDVFHGMDAVYAAFAQAEATGSPLVFDLDGDGIELVSLNNSDVFWDLDQDGFAERSAWVDSDDGLLVVDLDGDGYIKSQSELFGDLMTDGFSILSDYDSNYDGVIDANDAQFSDLLIWRDINQNGIGGDSELFTLTELNITSIDLSAAVQYQNFLDGNEVTHISSYTYDDGVNPAETRDVYDVWFQYDDRHTLYNQVFDLDPNTFTLPNFAGYGNLPSLQIAMSLDNDLDDENSLMSLVKEFSERGFLSFFSDDGTVNQDVRDIMFRWAGVDGIDPASRGQWVSALEIEFLEALVGQGYLQYGIGPNPGSMGALSVNRAFETAVLPIFGRIIGQIVAEDLFTGTVEYNAYNDSFSGFTGFNQTALDDLVAKAADANQVQNKTEFWKDVLRLVDYSIGVDSLTTAQYDQLEDAIIDSDNTLTIQHILDKVQHDIDELETWTPDGDYIYGTGAVDTYTGSVGDDYYSGGYGDDVLSGGIGNDILYGGADNDTLNGQLGDDYLAGDGGDDTYLFFVGHGDDYIHEGGGDDKILFGPDITATDLSFIRVGYYDLIIQLDPSVGYGSITIENQMSNAMIETLEFDDSSTLDMALLDHTYYGTEAGEIIYGVRTGYGGTGVDTLYGYGGDDTIYAYGPTGGASYTIQNFVYGGDGNDTIFAEQGGDYLSGDSGDDAINGATGNDTLIGGTGDDILKGDSGDDVYQFAYGDGNDVIEENSGNDKIVFDAGITLAMLDFTRLNNNDIVIEVDGGAGGSITIKYQTYGVGAIIETLEFSDSSTFDLTSVEYTLNGTAAGETLYGVNIGGAERDTIYGGDGNDIIYGYRSSADTTENFLYGGAGDDTVYGSHGADVIEGNDGNDLLRGNNGDDLITGGAGDDTLEGKYGDETYFFNYGDGNDLINEYSGNDKIVFGSGITAAMLDITRINNNDVLIEIDGGAGGSIELHWQTYSTGYIVETLEFSDASTIDLTIMDYTLEGTSAGETLYGVRYGGSGVDTIYGHEGNDIIYGYRQVGDYDDSFLYGGDGDDTIYGAHGVDYIEGNDGADTVFGYNGNDEIYGGAGNDTLRGGNNDDILYGEAGDDTLLGENNDDTLIGGLGADTLTGGGGYDTFAFLSGSSFDAVDTITDFSSTWDTIDISDLLTGYDPLTEAITDFVQITDDGTDSTLFVDADGGADNFVAIALIDNRTGLTDEDALETSGALIAV